MPGRRESPMRQSHFWLIFVSPCHEESWPGPIFDHGGGLLLRVFVKNTFQCRMNGTLAAVGHDDRIELLARLIENDFVVSDKRIFPDAIRSEVRLHIMPVKAGAADGHGRGAITVL